MNRVQPQMIRALVVIVATIVISVVSFVIGRSVERRTTEVNSTHDTSPPNAEPTEKLEYASSQEDNQKIQEIADLSSGISRTNWQLVTPFMEFRAGKIDAETLRNRTAEPEVTILRSSTQMYELANAIENADMRDKLVKLASAVLMRQRGFSMMIDGYALADASQVAQGAKLFEDGRNDVITACLEISSPDSPQYALLKRLVEAYEPREK